MIKSKDRRIRIEELSDIYQNWAFDVLNERWGSDIIISRGKIHRADELPGFVAVLNDVPKGLITYKIKGDESEIVTVDSFDKGIGIGTALIDTVRGLASSSTCKRIWLITTNDNKHALRFYQNYGFKIVAVHENAIAESRKLKPQIPEFNDEGVPIKDEIELEILLDQE